MVPVGDRAVRAAGVSTIADTVAIDAYNVYSPNAIIQGGTLVIYFGGWYQSDQTHDVIYRAECPTLGGCAGAALLLDSVALGFEHLNDPSVILRADGTYLMYMTGVPAGQLGWGISGNHVFVSASPDVITWSQPGLLFDELWLPSATIGGDGRVYVYGNCATCGEGMVRYTLAADGLSVQAREEVSTPSFYANVEVRYRWQFDAYEILGETNPGSGDQIDYLVSPDGLHWQTAVPGVLRMHPGDSHMGTPAAHPDSDQIVYYGATRKDDNTGHQIWSAQWGVAPPSPDLTLTIAGYYEDILDREPARSEVEGWVEAVNGGMRFADVRRAFGFSEEARADIAELFRSYFSRDATGDDLDFWSTQLTDGYALYQLRCAFSGAATCEPHRLR